MFGHLLESPRTHYLAALASLFLGLFFTFVWAPHPWTWEGIDQYHDLARALARGDGFNTTDVPWGFAYYVAFFYRVFGERPWLPILGQVLANATMPIMLFAIVKPLAGQRTAALSALITGVFSFNTVYASTQMSDAICSVLFLAAVLCFFRGHALRGLPWFASSGFLLGLASQFRPNLLPLPIVVAAAYVAFAVIRQRDAVGTVVRAVAIFLACSMLAPAPWVIRNYRLAGVFLPTSSHGAIQLWYGSLQVGPSLENYTENPRSAFARAPFDYTSLVDTPIVLSIDASGCTAGERERLALTYWTDRDPKPSPVRLVETLNGLEGRIPGQADGTAVYWRLEPSAAEAPAAVYFVSSDHTRNLDRHDDVVDVFDLIELVDGEPHADRPAIEATVRDIIGANAPVPALDRSGGSTALHFYDGSVVRIPRPFNGDLTDVIVEGNLARQLVTTSRRRSSTAAGTAIPACVAGKVGVNDVFYRRELHQMRRYSALAFDNIRREPVAFAAAAAYRSVRLFIVRPSGGGGTTYQFAGSSLVYAGALLLSATYFLVFVAGVVIAWQRRSALLAFLVPILYVPATICFVLTNQRYTVTMQPLMFALVALAVVAFLERRGAEGVRG